MKKLRLILPLMVLAVYAAARAQDSAPVTPVQEAQTQDLSLSVPVVLELFSSQACAFCPKAENLMADMIQNKNVIGLACHVDYFDVRTGSLAQPFCTERQNNYARNLRTGLNYTPQMVINGAYDVIGYKLPDILAMMRKAAEHPPKIINIEATQTGGVYQVNLPALAEGLFALEMVFFDNPHTIEIAEGVNRGKTVTYYNIISRIDPMMDWDGQARPVKIKTKMGKKHKGFVILGIDKATGHIMAAGKFERLETKAQ